jgi:membrane protease YdiL (CAAX protease family)
LSADDPTKNAQPVRLPPTLGRGFAVAVLYALVFLVGGLISGVDYDEITADASNVLGFVIIPVGLGILVTLGLTARWGWWRALFHEERKLTEHRWLRLIPVLLVLNIVIVLALSPWEEWNAGLVLLILLGTLMVGFAEEIVFRGYLLVGARARYTEVGAWFVSSGLFALFHGLNIITGQAVGTTITQVVFAFVFGSALYFVRRLSGLLVVGMVIHGFWDFSSFISAGRGDEAGTVSGQLAAAPFTWGTALLTIAGLIVVFRRRKPESATAA